MASRFNHLDIEKYAQQKWESEKVYETNLNEEEKDPYYLLFEFPYPSGDLHIGHWYAYAVTDIYARQLRAQGKNVLFPIGFDAFGLPAENAAIKQGADPKEWTYQNMQRMRGQIKQIGTSVDWSKEVVTCDPEYYKWTQWLFLKLYENGLTYRGEAPVKWCPKDKTVLANEQVIDGTCERCGSEVEEKKLTQWFMKITQYAERLLKGLDSLAWREEIKDAQRAWIGKSEGAKLWFNVKDSSEKIEVFTTRPDTVFGATYVVLAPEHPLVDALLTSVGNEKEVRAYKNSTVRKTERERSENKEKTGVQLEGVMAINPATKEEIPVYVADYVLGSYGTGAVMAVPAHDERDFAFAQKHKLSIKNVIQPYPISVGVNSFDSGKNLTSLIDEKENSILEGKECYGGDGLLRNSGTFNGKQNREVFLDIVKSVGGERSTNYRIRDWLVSRQRYWGCPIPVVYDPQGKAHAVPAKHLPWLLPTDVDFKPSDKAPLASSKELHARVEKLFGKGWTPEYDTLDTFVDSSWYFLRFLSPQNKNVFTDNTLVQKWMPVQRYSGGSEHTTMHLLYARFFYKALFDLTLVPSDEPFLERFNRALILGQDGRKMSKRWGNVINPDEQVKRFGADAVRMYLAFIGPYNEAGHYPWNEKGVESMRKLLERVFSLKEKIQEGDSSFGLQKALARASKKIKEDSDRFKFNTALSFFMVLTKEFESESQFSSTEYRQYLSLLAPFAPHLAEHLWSETGGSGSVHNAPWPFFDEKLLKEDEVTIAIQINGKRRGEMTVPTSSTKEEVVARAREVPALQEILSKPHAHIVYVPSRIINFVA
jgi:leucyl-tRNA synthetase